MVEFVAFMILNNFYEGTINTYFQIVRQFINWWEKHHECMTKLCEKYWRLILLKIFRNQTIVLKFGLLNKPLHGVVAKACQRLTFIAKTGLIKPRCIVIPRRGFGILMKSFETFDLQSISNLAFINLPLRYIL